MSLKSTSCLVLIILGLFFLNSTSGSRIVRVKLQKATSKQGGILGQPVTSYYTYIDVGTPPKPFKFLLDTDANESWLPHYSKLGIVFGRLNYKNGYCKKDSKTSLKKEKELSFNHQKCDLTGKPYQDVFQFKNVIESLDKVSFRQGFLAVSSASNDRFSSWNIDGVLSLSPAVASDSGTQSVLINLFETKLIEDMKFAFALNTVEDSEDGGELTLGGFNPTKFIGNIRHHPLISIHRRWELRLQNVMLGGEVVSCYNNLACTATLSTGVNDFYGPREDVIKIINLLGLDKSQKNSSKEAVEDKLFEIDCLRVANLPNLSFNIDGVPYVVSPTSYVKRKIDGLIFKSSTCYVGILPSDSIKHWILGTEFLANYYTIFDLNRRQIGFATLKG